MSPKQIEGTRFSQAAQPSVIRRPLLRSFQQTRYFLSRHLGSSVLEVSSIVLAIVVARGMWPQSSIPWHAALVLPLAWIGGRWTIGLFAFRDSRERARPKLWFFSALFGVTICGCLLRTLSLKFSWLESGGFALNLLLLQVFSRLLQISLQPASGKLDLDGVFLAVAQWMAIFSLHPFIRNGLLGAGDANSYSLAIEDFLEQRRVGVLPVLIGQSRFSFNGGFQPLRNAPFLQHLAWVFHVSSLHTMEVFALLNITVLASFIAAVLICYTGLRVGDAVRPSLALLSTALFAICPGILAPLYGGDMYPTFLATPFAMLLAHGILRTSVQPRAIMPWLLQGIAIAGIWWAHPPVAVWSCILAFAADGWIVLRERNWSVVRHGFCAIGVSGILSSYVFVSVWLLHLPGSPRADAVASIPFKLLFLRDGILPSFLPVSPNDGLLLRDLQLGYGFWICLVLSSAFCLRKKQLHPFMLCSILILIYLWPIPGVSRVFWGFLPTQMIAAMNQWPMQRLYPLLSVFGISILATGFELIWTTRPRLKVASAVLLAGSLVWGYLEMPKFFHRGNAVAHTEQASRDYHLRENFVISRSHSYEYLGTPPYFSNGHMDPALEYRLIDPRNGDVFADGSTLNGSASLVGVSRHTFELSLGSLRASGERVRLYPGELVSVAFDFHEIPEGGELQLLGGNLINYYSLPQSGYPRAFGVGPEASHTLLLTNSNPNAEEIDFKFVEPSAGAKLRASVTVTRARAENRVIDIRSWVPLSAEVRAARSCNLETPKLFVPGYRAQVDGLPASVVRSANGLVSVPVAAGVHQVKIEYRGSPALVCSYFLSLAGALAVLGCALVVESHEVVRT